MTDEAIKALIERSRREIADSLENIPFHCREGAEAYILTGRRTGDFLTAVFSNNLVEAAGRADDVNQRSLFQYASLLYNAPAACWGSLEEVKAWTAIGGLAGYLADAAAKEEGE